MCPRENSLITLPTLDFNCALIQGIYGGTEEELVLLRCRYFSINMKGVRSQELGVRSQELGVRSQELGVRMSFVLQPVDDELVKALDFMSGWDESNSARRPKYIP